MPSSTPLHSSFASAAAGNNDPNARRSSRTEPTGLSDWSRRPNGATQTFRRPSGATNPSSHQHRDSNLTGSAQHVGPYVPPHISASRNGSALDTRYSREQLLDLFREQQSNDDLDQGLSGLVMGVWSRTDVHEDHGESFADLGAETCIERSVLNDPLGFRTMNAEERQLFASSVNSNLKGLNAPGSREGPQRDVTNHRKSSVSQNFATTTSGSSRPMTRRREQSESNPFSKETAKFGREESSAIPSSGLLRRRTELRDDSPSHQKQDEDRESSEGKPYGSLRRISGGPLSAGLGGPQSPWSATPSDTFAGLGPSNGSNPASSSSTQQRRPGLLQRGESRFRNLMGKESIKDQNSSNHRERMSLGGVGRLSDDQMPYESLEDGGQVRLVGDELSSPSRYDTTSSATLVGAHDESPLSRPATFGLMQESHLPSRGGVPGYHSAHEGLARNYCSTQSIDQALQPQQGEEPLSPTITNPYQSPERSLLRLNTDDDGETDLNRFHLPGLGALSGGMAPEPVMGTRNLSAFDPRSMDRGQDSGMAASRGLPGLGSLGGLGGSGAVGGVQWPSALSSGTPGRERVLDPFGEPRRSAEEVGSHSLSSLGGPGAFGSFGQAPNSAEIGTTLRSGRLGSLFPSDMQEQIRQAEQPSFGRQANELRGSSGLLDQSEESFAGKMANHSLSGRSAAMRDGQSPFIDSPMDPSPAQGQARLQMIGSQSSPGQQQLQSQGSSQQTFQPSAGNSSSQLPAAQQKQMVMPDRIRWIYRDPSGNTQGPWSGLEMHDWYRAGFFSPELLVKKAEDAEFEPLAQLIRRIGNSREPFLVPQIGIPAPTGSQSANTWSSQSSTTGPAPNLPSAQPPFASSFPNFGTTLTAEQQNALERRKQEEQYLMARQKEHLAQQHLMTRMNMPGGSGLNPQQLQHQSSAHSLQSQPSYGSMTTPGTFPGQNVSRIGQTSQDPLSTVDEAEAPPGLLDRLGLGHTFPSPIGDVGRSQPQETISEEHHAAATLGDRARLQREQEEANAYLDSASLDRDMDNHRLRQFHSLQNNDLQLDQGMQDIMGRYGDHSLEESPAEPQSTHDHMDEISRPPKAWGEVSKSDAGLSLSEQVQQAASAKHTPSKAQASRTKGDTSTNEHHAPIKADSPLPAPAARRSGQNVAEALAAESVSQNASPSNETLVASVAPWAREPTGSQKHPSLKEIQDIEAKKAARQEGAAAAARRAAMERDLTAQPAAPSPGLPSSSTWGNNEPVTPSSAPSAQSAWAKTAPSKSINVSSNSKKTLQQIQQEEEALARKQKAVAAASQSANSVAANNSSQAISAGKRYADLAGKAAGQSQNSTGAPWTTVGAGGKTKTPALPGSVSNAAKPSVSPPAAPVVPAVKSKPIGTAFRAASSTSSTSSAQDEFKKWAIAELRPDLNKSIQVEDFVNSLCNLPAETDLITEAVYSSSTTMDSRHFAEEFVRRRALADKGKAQPVSSSLPVSQVNETKGGGWSEVARKGPQSTAKEDSGAFKIVATKKKGGKK